jgi:hypothetical protein
LTIFGKLAFWKHKDELSVPDIAKYQTNLGLGNPSQMDNSLGLNQDVLQRPGFDVNRYTEPGFGQEPMPQESGAQQNYQDFQGTPSQPSSFSKLGQARPAQQMQQAPDIYSLSKDIELLSSKIETVKAMLDHLSEKIEKIERIAEGEKETTTKRYNRW